MVFGTLGLLDPGIGALIGAAAFLGGSGRVGRPGVERGDRCRAGAAGSRERLGDLGG